MTGDVYVVDAVRTPVGGYRGALARVRPDDLAAFVLQELVQRSPTLDPSDLEDVYMGAANGAGEDNRNVARMASLLAGLPVSVPGVTVNRLCGSGLEAVVEASRAVALGDASLCLAGGVESMSRAPWVLAKPEQILPRGDETLHSTTLGWRLVNPEMPDEWTVTLGEGAELLADTYGIGRVAQDAFALASHRNAAAAWERGDFSSEVVRVPGTDLTQDECIRRESTMDRLAALRPVFREDGTVTAGNASPLNDGAAAMVLGDAQSLATLGVQPLARIAASAVSGVDPRFYGIGPVEAAAKALKRAGIGWSDVATIELNEAFAAQALACLAEWPELDPAAVNPTGGAIAIGHPLGCSGARILTTLAWRLRRTGARWGLAAMCIGVGQGIAMVLERS
ncbi:MAG TPA: thiolase family protein [Acidimicrobiales bacterium]|nr:thiolase family protein [Acidimicrobiales bacterium]